MATAEEVVTFLQETIARFEAFCGRFNKGAAIERKSWVAPGDVRVALSRGEVFEKASCVYCDLELDTPPVLAAKLGPGVPKMRALVLEIGIHPFNPHVPKSYIELRANIAGEVILAGGTDIFPYFPNRDDRDLFAARIREACERHGIDYGALQKVRADFFKSRYTGENVGSHAGIYFFELDSARMAFFTDMAAAYFSAYEEIVARRSPEPFSLLEKRQQEITHGQWAQWIMVEDEGTRFGIVKGIPIEALLGAILPPVARY